MNAYTSTRISTGQLYDRNRESTIVVSPVIELDGHEGSVVAIGKRHGYKPIVM